MTSTALLALVMLLAHGSAAPRGSMDPADAAPPIENGTPAMAATKPAPNPEAIQQSNAATGVSEPAKRPLPPRHHRRKTAQH